MSKKIVLEIEIEKDSLDGEQSTEEIEVSIIELLRIHNVSCELGQTHYGSLEDKRNKEEYDAHMNH